MLRQFGRTGITDAGMRCAMGEGRVLIRQELQIVRQDYAGDRALGMSDTHRTIDQMTYLFGDAGESQELAGNILEKILQVDLLLIGGAESCTCLLPNKRHYRHMVELGVVETVEEMNRARTGRGVAKTNLPGEFRVSRCHEGRHFLVADLHVLHKTFGLFQRHV